METYFVAIQEALNDQARDRLVEELERLAHHTESLLRVTAHATGVQAQAIRKRLEAALQTARSAAGRLRQGTVATAKAADRAVRRHPYESLGLAFGAGLLLGILATRKVEELLGHNGTSDPEA